jgi:hypothetical protein
MSHSRRNTPIRGITSSESERQDKQLAHRRERRRIRAVVQLKPDAEVLPHTRELSNPWAMAKDGKTRFDPAKYPKLMRK